MTDKRFHLSWFMNFTPDEWREPFGNGGMPCPSGWKTLA